MASAEITAQHVADADRIADSAARAASYGAGCTNPLSAENLAARDAIDYSKPPTMLANRDLVKITRLRLLTDRDFPFWDVSYCYGELRDGTPVEVDLGADQLRKRDLKAHLIELAKAAGRHGKSMGLLDDYNISKMW